MILKCINSLALKKKKAGKNKVKKKWLQRCHSWHILLFQRPEPIIVFKDTRAFILSPPKYPKQASYLRS